MNDEDDPRAGTELSELVQDLVDERLEARERPATPRGFTPRIVGGIDHAGKPKDKKRALARALSRHGLGKRDDDTRPLGGEEFVDMVRQLPPAQQWEIHDELMKRAKARASESAPSRNKRLRQERREAWWDAEATTGYYRAALDFHVAASIAQGRRIPEGKSHREYRNTEHRLSVRLGMLANWREALMRQLLTPAPDATAVAWKRRQLATRQHRHTDTTAEEIERAIAEDVAFLTTHPMRASE